MIGYFIQNRIIQRMKAYSGTIAASGRPLTPEQQPEMKALSATVARGGQITSVMLALALLGMSIAQYVVFKIPLLINQYQLNRAMTFSWLNLQ